MVLDTQEGFVSTVAQEEVAKVLQPATEQVGIFLRPPPGECSNSEEMLYDPLREEGSRPFSASRTMGGGGSQASSRPRTGETWGGKSWRSQQQSIGGMETTYESWSHSRTFGIYVASPENSDCGTEDARVHVHCPSSVSESTSCMEEEEEDEPSQPRVLARVPTRIWQPVAPHWEQLVGLGTVPLPDESPQQRPRSRSRSKSQRSPSPPVDTEFQDAFRVGAGSRNAKGKPRPPALQQLSFGDEEASGRQQTHLQGDAAVR